MKDLYLAFLPVVVLICVPQLADAEITLHEATDVTQTKATLSADFPDLSATHGFQYKYGELPSINEFSQLALDELSDPVQISTSGSYAWSARSARGWVESHSDLSAGQSSSMSATVTFYEASTITFEWSVDSEENIGILSFNVDGRAVRQISGMVDFTTVTYDIGEGEHTLTWTYSKTSETNVGLDLGMVRNINLQNTTPGEWVSETAIGSSMNVENIYPAQKYLYRAYSVNNGVYEFSGLGSFETLSIPDPFCSISVSDITQTKCTINSNFVTTDPSLKNSIVIGTYKDGRYGSVMEYYETSILDSSIRGSVYDNESYYYTTFHYNITGFMYSFTIQIDEPFVIKFDWGAQGISGTSAASIYFKVDDQEVGRLTATSNDLATSQFEYVIPQGNHRLAWYADGIQGFYARFGHCQLVRQSSWEKEYAVENGEINIPIADLMPNTKYQVIGTVEPNFESKLEQTWFGTYSDTITFTTLNVLANIGQVNDLKQASATIKGNVDGGDATIVAAGLQYRDAEGERWTDYPKGVSDTELSQNITRLRPSTVYNYRSYIQAQDCDTVFSEIGTFTTLPVEARKPELISCTQHSATLQGKVIFGDASIYQRGMQFRHANSTEWEEVEDAGSDSIYTLTKTGLEMGERYEARTYVQPAGCDVIYSDILSFSTLDNYFEELTSTRTQTTITMMALLSPVDESIEIEEYGFEYYADSDGFVEDSPNDLPSEVVRIPVAPGDDGWLRYQLTGLTPGYGFRYRAYAKINGEYNYYTSYKPWEWDYTGTQRATISVDAVEINSTSVKLKLDATQPDGGDAVVTQIEYAIGTNTQGIIGEYSVCGDELNLTGLWPNTQYGISFRGLVNGNYCPLLLSVDWDYSWYEFTTSDLTIAVEFSDITQTRTTMEVSTDFGDAVITNLKYSLNNGEWQDCGETVEFTGLTPNTSYTVRLWGKMGDEDYYWTTQPNSQNYYRFTTRSVTVSASASDVLQTAATIGWTPNYGDATYVGSGIEYGRTTSYGTTIENEEMEVLLTELLPTTRYYYRAYVDTEEGGRVYGSQNSFTTQAITCFTLPVSSISNRSATMNGEIDCDSYSSAEFGFQWKQMEGWNSDPAFTKGYKNEDGSISVALVNGMLEPNTDYQYRTAVRYQGTIYYASEWETFRTESEFVYYPASVYTIIRTDRENNRLILCGYYVAGSEEVTAQGYEYWNNSTNTGVRTLANDVNVINTDESMQYELDLQTLQDGNYSVRAFVETAMGITYGNTVAFGVQDGGFSSIADIEYKAITYSIDGSTLTIRNATGLSCMVCSLSGIVVGTRDNMSDFELFNLSTGMYIVRLSNGMSYKIIMK